MGWGSEHKPKHITTTEYLKSQYTAFSEPNSDYELLGMAVKLTSAYMAIKKKSTGMVYCQVILIRHTRDYFNISLKSMDEFSGPNVTDCPKKILELLTPLTEEQDPNGWATKWREKCWENIFNSANSKGKDYLITSEEVGFNNGAKFNCFVKSKFKRNCYYGVWLNSKGELEQSNGLYKFSKKQYDYSPCTKEMVIEGLKNIEKERLNKEIVTHD